MKKSIIFINRDNNGFIRLQIIHREFIPEEEVQAAEIEPEFYSNQDRKKVLFLPSGTICAIDRTYAKRSCNAFNCDAAIVHVCETETDRQNYLTRIAKVYPEDVKKIFISLQIPFINYENDLACTDIYLVETPVSTAAAVDNSVYLEMKPAYVGQEYGDIRDANLKIYSDRSFTAYQNRFGITIDDTNKQAIISMIETYDETNMKMAAMQMAYANLDNDESKNTLAEIINTHKGIIGYLKKDLNGCALLNVLNIEY